MKNKMYLKLAVVAFFIALGNPFIASSYAQAQDTQSDKTGVSYENLGKWRSLPEYKKEQLRAAHRKYQAMAPERQKKVRKNYRRYSKLDTTKRKQVRNNWEKFRRLAPAQKRKVKAQHARWKAMDPRKQNELKNRFKHFRDLPSGVREDLRRKRKRFDNLSPAEKDAIRNQYKDSPIQKIKRPGDQKKSGIDKKSQKRAIDRPTTKKRTRDVRSPQRPDVKVERHRRGTDVRRSTNDRRSRPVRRDRRRDRRGDGRR